MRNSSGFDPSHLYEYLMTARQKLLEGVRSVSYEQYLQEFPFGLKTLRDTIVEIPLAEWSYIHRIVGEDLPPWEERPFAKFYQTDFPPLERAWQEQAEETRRVLRSIEDWTRPLTYIFRPENKSPVRVHTTRGGVATQLVLHEVHHRAQAMAMLRQLGAPVQNLDYSTLTFQREEVPE